MASLQDVFGEGRFPQEGEREKLGIAFCRLDGWEEPAYAMCLYDAGRRVRPSGIDMMDDDVDPIALIPDGEALDEMVALLEMLAGGDFDGVEFHGEEDGDGGD